MSLAIILVASLALLVILILVTLARQRIVRNFRRNVSFAKLLLCALSFWRAEELTSSINVPPNTEIDDMYIVSLDSLDQLHTIDHFKDTPVDKKITDCLAGQQLRRDCQTYAATWSKCVEPRTRFLSLDMFD